MADNQCPQQQACRDSCQRKRQTHRQTHNLIEDSPSEQLMPRRQVANFRDLLKNSYMACQLAETTCILALVVQRVLERINKINFVFRHSTPTAPCRVHFATWYPGQCS